MSASGDISPANGIEEQWALNRNTGKRVAPSEFLGCRAISGTGGLSIQYTRYPNFQYGKTGIRNLPVWNEPPEGATL